MKIRSDYIRKNTAEKAIRINRKTCRAMAVLSSPEKRCQHFSRKSYLCT